MSQGEKYAAQFFLRGKKPGIRRKAVCLLATGRRGVKRICGRQERRLRLQVKPGWPVIIQGK